MAIVELQVVLEERLNCGRCDGIVIQVDDALLLAINAGVPVDELRTFIRGNIVSFEEVAFPGSCNIVYRYTISYDDALLLDPEEPLRACDIKRICCADCVLDYLDELDLPQFSSPECGVLTATYPNGDEDDITILTCTELPITGDGTAANPVGLLISADADNIIVLGSDSGVYAPAPAAETITTLNDNGDVTFTYTSEDSTVTTFDAAHALSEPVANTVRLTRPDATFDDVVISVNHTLTEPVPNTIRLTRPDLTFDDVVVSSAPETITTLNDNGDNTFTYTSEDSTVTTFDAEHDFARTTGINFRLTRPDGTFQDAAVTDTTTIGSVGFTSTGTPDTLAGPGLLFTSSTLGSLVLSAPATRGVRCFIEISMRPNFRFDPGFNSELSISIDVSLNFGAFTPISTHILRYDFSTSTALIARSEYYTERLLEFIGPGANLDIRARMTITGGAGNAGLNTSELLGLNGSIGAICSTV